MRMITVLLMGLFSLSYSMAGEIIHTPSRACLAKVDTSKIKRVKIDTVIPSQLKGTFYAAISKSIGSVPVLTVRHDGTILFYYWFRCDDDMIKDPLLIEEKMNEEKFRVYVKVKVSRKKIRLFVDVEDWRPKPLTFEYDHSRYKLRYNVKDKTYEAGHRQFLHEGLLYVIPIGAYAPGRYRDAVIKAEPIGRGE